MRKLFMAMVVVLTSSLAYAQADGGVQQKQTAVAKTKIVTPDQLPGAQPTQINPLVGKIKCNGIQVNRVEALGFGMSYDTFILVTGQVLRSQNKTYRDFLDEPTQIKIVEVLKRNDVIVKLTDDVNTSHCLAVSPDEAYTVLKQMFRMAGFLQENHASDQFDAFFLMLTKNDEKLAMALVSAAGSYTNKLAALAKTSPNFGK